MRRRSPEVAITQAQSGLKIKEEGSGSMEPREEARGARGWVRRPDDHCDCGGHGDLWRATAVIQSLRSAISAGAQTLGEPRHEEELRL